MDSYNQQDLNALYHVSRIIVNQEIRDRRKAIRKGLILGILADYSKDREFDIGGLKKLLLTKTGLTFTENDIVNVLEDLQKEGIVSHKSGKKYLIIEEIDNNFEDRFDMVWHEFLANYFNKFYSDYDPHLHKSVRKVLEELIIDIIQRFSIDDLPVNDQFEDLPIENVEPVIDEKIQSIVFQKNLKIPIKKSIIDYISSNTDNSELHKFIFECYFALINKHIIETEQDLPDLDFCNEIKFLLLDTSFIIPLLCETDPKHSLSATIIDFCKDKDVNLYFSVKTQNEMNGLISNLMNPYRRPNQRSSRDNQFIQDFLKKSEENVGWEEYYTEITHWKNSLEFLGIREFIDDDRIRIDEDISRRVNENLRIIDSLEDEKKLKQNPQYEPRVRGDTSYEHDGYSVGLVYYCKFGHYSAKNVGPLFLTYDNRLAKINELLTGADKFGLIIQPRAVLNYILAFSALKIDESNQEKVGSALLKYTARLQHPHLTFDEYLKLFSIRTGLEKTSIDVLKRVIVETPLIEEINKSLKENDEIAVDESIFSFIQSPTFQETINKVIISDKEKETLLNDNARYIEVIRKQKAENIALSQNKQQITITNISYNHYSNYNFEFNSYQVDQNILAQFDLLMKEIEAKSLFNSGILEKPKDKIRTKKQLSEWLKNSVQKISKLSKVPQEFSYVIGLMNLIINLCG